MHALCTFGWLTRSRVPGGRCLAGGGDSGTWRYLAQVDNFVVVPHSSVLPGRRKGASLDAWGREKTEVNTAGFHSFLMDHIRLRPEVFDTVRLFLRLFFGD